MPDAFGFAMATAVLVAVLAVFGIVSWVVAGVATELRCSFGAAVASGLRAWNRDPEPDGDGRERIAGAGDDTGPGDTAGSGEPDGPGVEMPVTQVPGPGLLPWHSLLGRQLGEVPALA